MQSCLESVSMSERHEELVRSDYNYENQYSVTHPDALGNSGQHGKGTGRPGGTKNLLPNCSGTLGQFDYSNWDTDPASNAGNCQDNEARRIQMARSLYSYDNPYSLKMLDRDANIAEGQYVVPTRRLGKAEREHCALTMPGVASY